MGKEVSWFAIKHYYIIKYLFHLEKKPVIVENIKEDRYSGRVSIVFAINAIFEVQRFIQLLVL